MISLPDCIIAATLLLPAGVHARTQLQVEELVRVGPPAAEFAALTDVALTSAGALWIADGMAGEVHLWVDGLLRQVAGTGDGPGEVRAGALELVAVGGDTVIVVEPGRSRMSVFAPGGAFVRTLALEQVPGLTSGWRHVGGRLYARVNRQTMVQPGAAAPEGGDPVVMFDLGGRRVGDAAELPQSGSFRMGSGGRPTIELLASEPVWDVDESGRVLVARTDAYEVRSEAPGGGGGVVVRNEVAAARPADDVVAKARELLRETMAARRMPDAMIDGLVASAGVADRAPVLGGVFAGPGGTIWVQDPARTGAELIDLERPGGRTWRILDGSGGEVASVRLPHGFRLMGMLDRRLYGVLVDDMGQTSAVVLRVNGLR